MYYARTGIEINTEKFTEFLESWLYEDGHCYVTYSNDKVFNIALNFPGSDQLILKQIKRHLQSVLNSPTVIASEASGLQFESRFHSACLVASSKIKFPIVLESNTVITLTAHLCSSDDISGRLTTNVIYKLYSYHPAVDYVGEVICESIQQKYLQLSVSTYLKHRSKVWHLLKKYEHYEEFKEVMVLNYYKSLCDATNILYVCIYFTKRPFYTIIFNTTCKRQKDGYTTWTTIVRYSR